MLRNYDDFYKRIGVEREEFLKQLIVKNPEVDEKTFTLLEPYLADRILKQDGFNQACAQLLKVLLKFQVLDKFKECFDNASTKGILATQNMQKTGNAEAQDKINTGQEVKKVMIYHDGPHAAEMCVDVGEELGEFFDKNALSSDLKKFFIPIAEAAAAGHDRVQNQIPPVNEQKSAEATAEDVRRLLQTLEVQLLSQNKNQGAQQEIKAAFSEFNKYLNFIFEQLIVAPTFLLWAKGAKPLLTFYFDALSLCERVPLKEEEKLSPAQKNASYTFMDFIDAAGIAISAFDTSRSLAVRKLQEKTLLNKLKNAGGEHLQLINAFFEACKITEDAHKEGFLLRITQHLRMYPEMPKDLGRMQKLINLVTTMDQMRGEGFDVQRDKAALLEEFEEFTKDHSIHSHAGFSESLAKGHRHTEMAQNRKLKGLLTTMQKPEYWSNHANHLKEFQNFYARRMAEDKQKLAHILIYLAAQQAGVDYIHAKNAQQRLAPRSVNPHRKFAPKKKDQAVGEIAAAEQDSPKKHKKNSS